MAFFHIAQDNIQKEGSKEGSTAINRTKSSKMFGYVWSILFHGSSGSLHSLEVVML